MAAADRDEVRIRARLDGGAEPGPAARRSEESPLQAGVQRRGVDGMIAKGLELTRCLETLQAGDTLIGWKLDRLDRGVRNLMRCSITSRPAN
jgi:hypothetical protein